MTETGTADGDEFRHPVSRRIRSIALRLPETSEGTSCVNRAFKAAGKNFAFLGEKDDRCGLRLKLDASLPEVAARSGDAPEQYEVGTSGWVMLRFGDDDHPPVDDLERWVVESYSLLAPKRLVKMLPTPSTPSA